MKLRGQRYELVELFDGSYALYGIAERKPWWSRRWEPVRELVYTQSGPMALTRSPVISLDRSWVEKVKVELERRLERRRTVEDNQGTKGGDVKIAIVVSILVAAIGAVVGYEKGFDAGALSALTINQPTVTADGQAFELEPGVTLSCTGYKLTDKGPVCTFWAFKQSR